MTAPNLKSMNTVTGKTTTCDLTSTSGNILLSNDASSGTVLKINTVIVANTDPSNAIEISLLYNPAASGAGSGVVFAPNITVPSKSSIALLGKDTSIYLEEDRSLTLVPGSANKLKAIISYEEIS